MFTREFEKASRARDATATSRFFKLFPAIGWEAEGLQAYAAFVVELVKVRAPASAKSASWPALTVTLRLTFPSVVSSILHHCADRAV